MLEIPVNTCNITYKPSKKRRRAKRKSENPDAVKEELLLKVNSETESRDNAEQPFSDASQTLNTDLVTETVDESVNAEHDGYASASVHKKARKPFFKMTAVTAELVAIFALIATIFLTNAFYADSAINVFMRKVFSPSATETVHEKTYDEFSPVMNFSGETNMENGLIVCSGSGAVYAPLDGTVSSVTLEEDGTYTLNVEHSAVFCTVISGLSYAYLGKGDAVYGNIPVGYVNGGEVTMCFNSGDAVITDYSIENNVVVWAV